MSNLNVKVMKFGGTSMNDMEQVHSIVEQEGKDSLPALVVSAFAGHTDKLLAVANEIENDPRSFKSPNDIGALFEDVVDLTLQKVPDAQKKEVEGYLRLYIKRISHQIHRAISRSRILKGNSVLWRYVQDRIVSIGEVFSAHVFAVVMSTRSQVRKYVDINLHTILMDSQYTTEYSGFRRANVKNEKVLYESIIEKIKERIKDVLMMGAIPVVTGYVGLIPGGILDTIDRGYTDSTAAMTAVAASQLLGPENVLLQIWKEVPGLMSADPRIVENGYNSKTHVKKDDFKNVQLRRKASYKEAAELAGGAGMKAINQHGVLVLDGTGIDMEIRNTFDPKDPGTRVSDKDDLDLQGVRFVSGKKNQTMIRFTNFEMNSRKGVAAEVFTLCSKLGIKVDVITTSFTSITFSVDSKHSNREKLEALLAEKGKVDSEQGMAVVACIGNSMRYQVGLFARLTGVMAKNGINIEFDSGDADSNITFVVKDSDYEKAIKALHAEMIESGECPGQLDMFI